MNSTQSPGAAVREIVRHLEQHGCPAHAAGAQQYFKETVKSYGWRAPDLRAYARTVHKALAADQGLLMDVAERLFAGKTLEAKALGVLVLQPSLRRFGNGEFRRFEKWLKFVISWADHDALATCLLGPMIVADPRRLKRPLRWAASPDRWHKRAAAVSLIHGIRRGLFMKEARAVTERLLADRDDMVQKGLGWLLREWAKYHPAQAVPVLMAIRGHATRLVLRTGCEKLGPADRRRILERL
jgi:3-methyladenine DNA glycosylase AlkD